MNNFNIYLTFILLCLPLNAEAEQHTVIESFSIKPSICIVERDATCKQNIRFQWHLSRPGNTCLYQVGVQQPIFCDVDKQHSSIVLMLSVEKENNFILRLSGSYISEIHRKLNIRELGKDVRQSRKHLWSVF